MLLRRSASVRSHPSRLVPALVPAFFLLASVLSCGDGPSGPPKPTTGSLQIAVTGLPATVQASISVSGPNMSARPVVGSETLAALPPGTYTIAAVDVSTADSIYAPQPSQQQITVAASSTPVAASVSYAVASGALALTINGLPSGTDADVTVSGMIGGFVQHLTGSTTLSRLRAGRYTVTAAPVRQDTTTYYVATVPATQTVTVAPGATATAQVDFRESGGLNLMVDGLYIVQSVQRLDRSVPVVQGRDGLLRVFVRASEAQTPAPAVRVRFYRAGAVVFERTIAPPVAYAPTSEASANEGALATSWNVAVPAAVFQPGLSVSAEVDPDDVVPERDETDNVYPLGGAPLDAGVRALPPFRIRFVPIFHSTSGLTGDVNTSSVDRFLAVTRKLHPISTIESDVRAPYTYSQPSPLDSDNDSTWVRVLHEVDLARDLDSDGASWSYYGVAKVTYTSGIAGLGYIGYPVAMGWDYLPSGSEVMAHELGHTWGRKHAPCGVAGSDTNYPYAGGQIGAYGYDATTGLLKQPSAPDIMGYCSGKWISDYTYNGVLAYRAANAAVGTSGGVGPASGGIPGIAAEASEARGPVQRCLLVWGRVSDRGVTLEPAFEVDARPSLPREGGPLALSATSASGATLWSLSFGGSEIADSRDHSRTFAYTIPVAQAHSAEIATLRLSAPGGQATSRVAAAPPGGRPGAPAASEVSVARTARPRWVRVRWNVTQHPVVMVRDPRTGAVLSFARGGDAQVRTPSDAQTSVDVLLSDRVRSVSRRVTVDPR